MDEVSVRRVLASYCPPLSFSQVDAIAEEIVSVSGRELAAVAAKASTRSH